MYYYEDKTLDSLLGLPRLCVWLVMTQLTVFFTAVKSGFFSCSSVDIVAA